MISFDDIDQGIKAKFDDTNFNICCSRAVSRAGR